MSKLLDIEYDIDSITNAARLLGHLATSDLEIRREDIEAIRGMIENQIDNIHCLWTEAVGEARVLREAHEKELEAVKAEKAAPGSEEDREYVEGLWSMLRAFARVANESCDRAGIPPARDGAAPAPEPAPPPEQPMRW